MSIKFLTITTPKRKNVRVASIESTEYAIIWRDQLNREGDHPHTWEAIK